MKRRCVVCWELPAQPNDFLCKPCERSLYKSGSEDAKWAARRARRYERARQIKGRK